MEQLNLTFPKPEKKRRTLIVDTIAANLHKKEVINLGIEFAAEALDADVCYWRDTIPNIAQYETIGFNISYITYCLNAAPFLKRHGIEPWMHHRVNPRIIFGGQGATSMTGGLDYIGETFYGEADGNYTDSKGWRWMSELTSDPVIRYRRGVLELTRGCKYACKFCEYSHVLGGPYREKDLELVKDQIRYILSQGKRRITLRTANLAGYSKLDELLEFCLEHRIYQGWTDISLIDAERIMKWLEPLRITAPKVGIESFDEETRKRHCGSAKSFTDDYLEEILFKLMEHVNKLHIYLIYGFEGDNYARWFQWIRKLGKKRDSINHNLQVDFSITNLNPCPGTPLAKAPVVDFVRKRQFITKWIAVMKAAGFYKQSAEMGPGSDYGRHGRLEDAYKLTMLLRTGSADLLTEKILYALPYGVGRSIKSKQANKFIWRGIKKFIKL